MEPRNPDSRLPAPSIAIYGIAERVFINVDDPDETFTMTCGCHYNAGMGGRSPLHPHVPIGQWAWCHGTVVNTAGCGEHRAMVADGGGGGSDR